ncbi:hypothetical protein M5X11_33280 [Paenibacillus alginolyticus]|uniref:hypothetical protein n=1 Tax=Paenibacillus alginolyticus TaxID=59839 RepID=UPI0004130626|nr:hypothetical protein [Paenibacillus alginolyticus]MCY9669730.1 hypothetical protein [Paenibacillus alginolyticus]
MHETSAWHCPPPIFPRLSHTEKHLPERHESFAPPAEHPAVAPHSEWKRDPHHRFEIDVDLGKFNHRNVLELRPQFTRLRENPSNIL